MAGLTSDIDAMGATVSIQNQTKASILRMQQQYIQTQQLGNTTLSTLQSQRKQTERIEKDARRMEYELAKTNRQLNKFDRFGGKLFRKRAAKKEVKGAVAAGTIGSCSLTIAGGGRSIDGAHPTVPGGPTSRGRSHKVLRSRILSKEDPPQSAKTPATTPVKKMNCSNNNLSSKEENDQMSIIKRNDDDIDDMLRAMDGVLDNLNELSMQMKEETSSQNKHMEVVAETIEKSNIKQAVVNSRVQRSLVGKWKNRKL